MRRLLYFFVMSSLFFFFYSNAHASFYDDGDFDGADLAALNAAFGYAKGNPNYNPYADLEGLQYCLNLIILELDANQFSDISPLASLDNLSIVGLSLNQISDISALVSNPGIGSGDEIYLGGNPLSTTSCNTYIPELTGRGVTVLHDCP